MTGEGCERGDADADYAGCDFGGSVVGSLAGLVVEGKFKGKQGRTPIVGLLVGSMLRLGWS